MSERVEYLLVHLAILVPAFTLLLLAQTLNLRDRARSAGSEPGLQKLILISLISLVVGFATGAAVEYGIAFGPGQVCGNLHLAWYTGPPGLFIGIWLVYKATVVVGARLLDRTAPTQS